jgi:hypothetical protein
MLDDLAEGAPVPGPRCTWCSAELASDHETVCPSCGATLVGDGETQVPGLTAIDAEAILRNARAAKAKPRGRLMSWISGDYGEDAGDTAPPGSLAPPPLEVRREILLLELEAQVANAQAEVESMAADAALAGGSMSERPAASAPAPAPADPAGTAAAPATASMDASPTDAPETGEAAPPDDRDG